MIRSRHDADPLEWSYQADKSRCGDVETCCKVAQQHSVLWRFVQLNQQLEIGNGESMECTEVSIHSARNDASRPSHLEQLVQVVDRRGSHCGGIRVMPPSSLTRRHLWHQIGVPRGR
jgi:hypothetical protein